MEAMDLLQISLDVQARAETYPPEVRPFVTHMLTVEAFSLDRSDLTQDWSHRSYQQLVLEHAQPRVATIRTDDRLDFMEVGQCYYNAYSAVLEQQGYTYVEGYAQTRFMVVEHAWLEDRDGTVIDPTWANLDSEVSGFEATYAGIRFTSEFVLANAARTGWTGILASDWREGHRILQHGLKINRDGMAYGIGDANA